MILRLGVLADLPAVVAVQQEGSLAALGHIFPQQTHPFPREAILSRWEKEIADPTAQVFVDEEDGLIRGFAATQADQMLHFGTAVDSWGSGLASAMHDAVLATWDNSGLTHVWLWVFEENHRAQRFYAKHGWSQTGESKRSAFAPNPLLVKYSRPL